MESEWITVREAAEILQITVSSLYNRLRRREIATRWWRDVPEVRREGNARLYLRREEVVAAASFSKALRIYRPDNRHPAIEDVIYLAGLFDGEGCITIHYRVEKTHVLTIQLTNTCREVLDWIAATFGGCVNGKGKAGPRWKPVWVWRASSVDAYRTLQRIAPFFRIKHRQARLGIEFFERVVAYNGNAWKPISPEELEWRESLRQELKALNRKGPRPSQE